MQVGSTYPSGWNVTLYLQFKSSFFFTQSATFPSKSFWNRFNLNATIKWSMKVQKVCQLQDLEREHWPWHLQHSTSQKIVLTFLVRPLMEPSWPENHYPTYIPLFQHQCFSFPLNINFGWLCKSVTHHYQHKYWNIFILDFHYNSTHIKFPKINSFLFIRLQTFSS